MYTLSRVSRLKKKATYGSVLVFLRTILLCALACIFASIIRIELWSGET